MKRYTITLILFTIVLILKQVQVDKLEKELAAQKSSIAIIDDTLNLVLEQQVNMHSTINPIDDIEGYKRFVTNVLAGKYDNK